MQRALGTSHSLFTFCSGKNKNFVYLKKLCLPELGGYVIPRHNSIRDLFAELLSEVCKDVITEPPLLPLTGETLPAGSNLSDGARLVVVTYGPR